MDQRTGNTSGTPPLIALLPSNFAASLNHSLSCPSPPFQLITVAPCSRTSTLSPVGSTASTRECACVMLTCACGGRPGVVDRAVGFLGRSTMAADVAEEGGEVGEFGRSGSVEEEAG